MHWQNIRYRSHSVSSGPTVANDRRDGRCGLLWDVKSGLSFWRRLGVPFAAGVSRQEIYE